MTKKTSVKANRKKKQAPVFNLEMAQNAVFNSLLRRRDLINTLLSPGRDIDTECGYPTR
ncbi:unnamed protein product, partial [marine sediment metagenome]